MELTGWVSNDADGVRIEVQGSEMDIQRFISNLREQLPDSARIDSEKIDQIPIEMQSEGDLHGFTIRTSQGQGATLCDALPDAALCEDCTRELYDRASSRYLYPMISCTQCGPRYSIQTGIPFDRGSTTLSAFPLCDNCQREYTDPENRRFHAQTIGCYECGPSWTWQEIHAEAIKCTSPKRVESVLQRCEEILQADGIVLLKSVGGYQLLCDAASEKATQRIRKIKNRERKPFALLLESIEQALRMVELSPEAQVAIEQTHRPIVVASRKRSGATWPTPPERWICELQCSLGVMLPNSPMQLLLARHIGRPLVVTSANISGQPMLIDDRQAIEQFGDLVDAILMHDRQIVEPLDDPVLSDTPVGLIPIRLGRGNTPCRLTTDSSQHRSTSAVALGGDLKAAWGMSHRQGLYLMQQLGDASDPAVIARIEESIQKILQSDLPAESILIDMHPMYETTMLGKRLAMSPSEGSPGVLCHSIQHHAAHLGSLAVDAGIRDEDRLIGFVFDGTGYGPDGTVWGGEILEFCCSEYFRLGSLRGFRLPGGDVAAKNPWRTALALILDAGITIKDLQTCCDWPTDSPWGLLSESEQTALVQALSVSTLSIHTSSMGRWIDGLASLLGLVHCNDYEGYAAMRLEDLALAYDGDQHERRYEFAIEQRVGLIEFDGRAVVGRVIEDLRHGIDRAKIAFGIHASIATMMTDTLKRLPEEKMLNGYQVGLSGGVFQNRLLVELAYKGLQSAGHRVCMHRHIPPNDSGLAIGQLRSVRSV
jgi:hydrogenase maturation protein HypF